MTRAIKVTEKLKGCSILYTYGYSVEDLVKLMKAKSPREIIKYLKSNLVVQGTEGRRHPKKFSEEDYAYIKYIGFDSLIYMYFPEIQTQESEPLQALGILTEEIVIPENESTVTRRATYDSEVSRFKQLINLPDVNNLCSVCENKGTIYLPNKNGSVGVQPLVCPKCKGKSRKNKTAFIDEVNSQKLRELIPNRLFREASFSMETLDRGVSMPSDLKDLALYKDYLGRLESLLTDFRNGQLPKNSFLLTAPDNFGKKHFVYQSIKYLMQYEYRVPPLLDISDFHQAFRNYDFDKLDSFFEYDILFINISSTWKVIFPETYAYILSRCEYLGIPALFISRLEGSSIINQRTHDNQINLSWGDIFSEYVPEYDYSHILNIGIVGYSAKDIYEHKRDKLHEFLNQRSPIHMKENTYNNKQASLLNV